MTVLLKVLFGDPFEYLRRSAFRAYSGLFSLFDGVGMGESVDYFRRGALRAYACLLRLLDGACMNPLIDEFIRGRLVGRLRGLGRFRRSVSSFKLIVNGLCDSMFRRWDDIFGILFARMEEVESGGKKTCDNDQISRGPA